MNYHTRVFELGQSRPRLTIVRGLPGSGKSTKAQELCRANTMLPENIKKIHLETDMFWKKNGGYEYDEAKAPEAHQWCLTTTKVMLSQGYDVWLSNTFTEFKEVEKYVSFCIAHNYNLSVYTMSVEKNYGTIHPVPQEVQGRMRARFEAHNDFIAKFSTLMKTPLPGLFGTARPLKGE